MKTPTTREAFARLCEFKWQIAAIGIGLTVGFCAPPPAHAEPRRSGDLYTRYPFQTPAQASRQLDLQAEQRRRDRTYEDQRQEDRRFQEDQRQLDRFERDLREVWQR